MFNFEKIKTAGNLEWIVSSVGNFQIFLRNFRQEFLWPMPVCVLGWQTGHTHTVWSSGTQGKQKAARMTVVQLPLPNNNNNPKKKWKEKKNPSHIRNAWRHTVRGVGWVLCTALLPAILISNPSVCVCVCVQQ